MEGIHRKGPGFWHIIHHLAYILQYKSGKLTINPRMYESVISFIIDKLGCSVCIGHARNNFRNIIHSDDIFSSTVKIHNKVNKMNSKSVYTIQEAYREHSSPRRRTKYVIGINYLINHARIESRDMIYNLLYSIYVNLK